MTRPDETIEFKQKPIEAAITIIKNLENENKALREQLRLREKVCDAALKQCNECRFENERFREALEKIASGALFQHAHEHARAALEEAKK